MIALLQKNAEYGNLYFMEKKKIAKRYLISTAALFAGGFVIAYLTMLALLSRGGATVTITSVQQVLLSLALALLPAGSYTGFVLCGLKLIKREAPGKGVMIAVCIFFPITLALLTLFGIIMIIPGCVLAVRALLQREE